MTEAYVNNLEKLVKQNDAEIIDGFDGCLLDNMLYQAKRGVFAIYEAYVNPNMSRYFFKFARSKEDIDNLYMEWETRRTAAEEGV